MGKMWITSEGICVDIEYISDEMVRGISADGTTGYFVKIYDVVYC